MVLVCLGEVPPDFRVLFLIDYRDSLESRPKTFPRNVHESIQESAMLLWASFPPVSPEHG